jgi:hypothetical protein
MNVLTVARKARWFVVMGVMIVPVVCMNPVAQADAGYDHDSTAAGAASSTADQAEALRKQAQEHINEAKNKVERAAGQAAQQRRLAQDMFGTTLTEAEQRVCNRRQTVINSVMDRIGKRGGRHIELIDRTSERTQAFYKDKGLAVNSYDALLANIATAKATADTAAQAVADARADFACTSNDPVGSADSFKLQMYARSDAVKAYRDVVKALVLAVKAAAQQGTEAAQ